jgi:hypothetical protein
MTGGRRPTPSPAMWRIGLCSNVVEFAFSLLKRGIIHRMPSVRSGGHHPPGCHYSYSIPALLLKVWSAEELIMRIVKVVF